MINVKLFQQLIVTSIIISTISCSFIQKTKCYFPNSNYLCFYSFFINIIFGILFCISFTNINFIMSLWVGFLSFLGADTIYKLFEGRFSSYAEILQNRKNKKENNIK